ncbi:MAG: hypothetical protein JWO51_4957 [Rhodospirillales bacterium]|nr:hypothetical protein [Rhodospirillales bacterium]
MAFESRISVPLSEARTNFRGGMLVTTAGIHALLPGQRRGIIASVRLFSTFMLDCRPTGAWFCRRP